jgi:hypothetical protein
MTRTMGWVAGSMAWAAPSSSAHPRQQGEPVAQPAALTGRAEHLHGRFLGCRSVACAREEEGDRRNGGKGAQANKSTRLRQRKRRYRHHSSPRRRSGSRLVARTFSLGARSRACSASGAAATQPLDVVNKQEHLAGTEEGEQAVINRLARQGRDAKLLGHRLADQGDVGQRLERDERGAVRELVGGGMRGREGEGSLADTTRPGTRRRKQSAS